MKRKHNWLLLAGLASMVVGLCLILLVSVSQGLGRKQADALVRQIEAVLPKRSVGVPESLSDIDMPALSLQGQSFIGLVEIPAYGVKLPLCGHWQKSKIDKYPCRLDGSVYDNSLIIGGSAGQLACLKTIGHGDLVTVTDMQGAVYTYRVTKIRRTENAQSDALHSERAHLVLFMRDQYSLEYIVVECN